MLFLGIAIESHRTRAVVFSLESNAILSEGVSAHSQPSGGWWPDPSAWVRAVNESALQCLQNLGDQRGRLAGISVCGPELGLVLLDARNQLLRPRVDYEAEAAAGAVREFSRHFGGRPGALELLGRPFRAESTASYLLWLKKVDPETFAQVSSVFQPQEFINFWLTGVKRGGYSGGTETGLLDVRTQKWCPEVIEWIDPQVGEWLPDLHPAEEVAGGLRPEVANAWGVSDHLLVAAGGSRAAMEAMGAGAINPGEVMVTVSDRRSVRAVVEEPMVDPLGELVLGCDAADQWLLSLERCVNGNLVEEVKEQWGWDRDQFERVAATVSPGAGGLHYSSGNALGALHGLKAGNLTSPNLARAAMEATVDEVKGALDRLEALGVQPARVKLVGASDKTVGWRQVLADALGEPVASASVHSSPSVGAALQAAVVFYHSSGENLTFTEVAEYALPVGESDWSFPANESQLETAEMSSTPGPLEGGSADGIA